MAGSVDEEALHQLYLWVDNIPLSRPKRNLSRDFSDGGVRSSVCVCVCVCVCVPRSVSSKTRITGLNISVNGL